MRLTPALVAALAYWSDLPMTDHPGLISRNNRERGHQHVVNGEPTHLRWLVMNSKTLQAHAFLFKGKPVAHLEHQGHHLWIADLLALTPVDSPP